MARPKVEKNAMWCLRTTKIPALSEKSYKSERDYVKVQYPVGFRGKVHLDFEFAPIQSVLIRSRNKCLRQRVSTTQENQSKLQRDWKVCTFTLIMHGNICSF